MLNSWLITLLVLSRFYPIPNFDVGQSWSNELSFRGAFLGCNKNIWSERSPGTGSPKEQWHRWTRHRSWWSYCTLTNEKRSEIAYFPKGRPSSGIGEENFSLEPQGLVWINLMMSQEQRTEARSSNFLKASSWALTDFHPTVESTLGACKYSLNELQYSDCEEETTCRRWMLEHRLSEEVEQQQLGQYPGIS